MFLIVNENIYYETNNILERYLYLIYLHDLLTAYYIFTPPDCITCVESQSVLLKYKLLINRFKVVYKRNDVAIINTNNINKIEAGRSKILQIIHITSSDEGEYCLEVAGNKSKPTQLVITRMLYFFLFSLTNN